MPIINSINQNNTDYLISGANTILTCTTASSTVSKTISSMPVGFDFDENVLFKIKFTNGNTASSPTLNNKSIMFTGGSTLGAGILYDCYYYDGEFFINNADNRASNSSLNVVTNKAITTMANGFIASSDISNKRITITDSSIPTPFNGMILKVLITSAMDFSTTTPTYTDIYLRLNNNNYPIKCIQNGTPNKPTVHYGRWGDASSYTYRIWDAYTTLNLIYNNGNFIIMDNPIFNSYFSSTHNYVVYANGYIEQWGEIQNSLITLRVHYSSVDSWSFVTEVNDGSPSVPAYHAYKENTTSSFEIDGCLSSYKTMYHCIGY